MEALAARLSQLDAHAEGAIRVVAFYDTLMRRRVDLPALARSSAGLAECVAGVRLHGTGRMVRASPDGTDAAAPPGSASTTVPITLDEEEVGAVWLERGGPPHPLDDVLLDRLAIAAAAVLERYGPARTTMADPALVELAVSSDCDEAGRARALRLLGFAPDLPVRAVAVRSDVPLDRVAALLCPGRPAKAAPLTDAGIILVAAHTDAGGASRDTCGAATGTATAAPDAIAPDLLPAGVRAGVGTAGNPVMSWREARTALRFTAERRPVVRHADLGALALLAEIPEDVARANHDVAAIARLARHPEDLETLDAFCATGSLRRAADRLHLHHSSVARRIEQITKILGIELTHPAGLLRAGLALTAWRLLDN
ncbi:helix-turn-helix domain-containing protein [Streptomyces sp. NPDC090021]|uniref:helix-turn-helix domain-containing protein n=1 Tax=Streptomyces sp. NPDC090021 TaxID=3365919 RepID=UPI00382C7868